MKKRLVILLTLAVALSGCLGMGGDGDDVGAQSAGNGSGNGSMNASPGNATGPNATAPGNETGTTQTFEQTIVAKDLIPNGDGSYSYDPAEFSVPVNTTVIITLESHEQNLWDHDIAFENTSWMSDTIGPGENTTLEFTVTEPGEYTYICTIGDHKERGMVGTMTVTAS